MKMMKILLAATAIAGAVSASPALAGTTITGSLQIGGTGTNFYDPAYALVFQNYGNHSTATNVAVGTGIEFGHDNTRPGGANTADFTPTSLLLTDISALTSKFGFDDPWTQTFTSSTPGFFNHIKAGASTFPNALDYTVTGDTLTVTNGGFIVNSVQPETFTANFTFDGPGASAAPEPATWGMMLVGFGTMGASMRYRRRPNKAVCA